MLDSTKTESRKLTSMHKSKTKGDQQIESSKSRQATTEAAWEEIGRKREEED